MELPGYTGFVKYFTYLNRNTREGGPSKRCLLMFLIHTNFINSARVSLSCNIIRQTIGCLAVVAVFIVIVLFLGSFQRFKTLLKRPTHRKRIFLMHQDSFGSTSYSFISWKYYIF